MNELKERMAAFGPAAMSDAELVGMVLGSTPRSRLEATVRSLLDVVGTPRGLASRRVTELASVPGMTGTRAHQLLAAIELGARAQVAVDAGQPLMTAADVAARCQRLKSEPNEVFLAIAVNARNRVTGEWVVARGWESGINLTPRQVFTLLAKEAVSRAIFVHCHPSGDPTPSPEDVRFTRRLIDAGRTLDIKVLDHVIVASSGHASIRETARGEVEFG